MKKILFIFLLILFISCKKEKTKSDQLIYYQSVYLEEMDNESYDKLLSKVDSNIKPKYLNDVIYVSKIIETNACGQYEGDIELKGDTIYLIRKLVSDEVCTSTSLVRITYIIKNPKEKKYKFLFK